MRTCQKCGKSVPDSAGVCPGCGAVLEAGPSEATQNIKPSAAPPPPQLLPEKPRGGGSKKVLAIVGLILLVAVVAVAVIFLRGGRAAFPGISRTGGSAGEFKDLQEMANEIEKLEKDMQTKGQDIAKLQSEYESKGGQLPIKGVAMTEEERKLLAELVKNEKSAYNDLLKEILSKDKELWDLKARLTAIEQQLPKPHIVKDGERHRDISVKFLRDQGLSERDARALVERVNTLDPLLPGFKVWNFYINGAFGTYVTQGTAEISPNEAERQKIQAIVDERNAAIAARDGLTVQVADLENQRTQLTEQVTSLTSERDTLTENVADLKTIQTNLESDLNSLYYRAGEKDELEKSGIIKDPFLGSVRLDQFKSSDFTGKIDLRTSNTISVVAAEFGMKKIKKAVILPSIFKENTDYRIAVPKDGQQATIEILNPDKFMLQKIVISLQD